MRFLPQICTPLLCVALSLGFLPAQEATTPPPQTAPADQPSGQGGARHTAKVAAVKAGGYDLALIGDSITQCLGDSDGEWAPLKAVWDRYYTPLKAINLGYSGYRTENILWNLQNGELDFPTSPKVFRLLIGTNNLDDQHYQTIHTAEQVFAGTKAIVDLIKSRHPSSKILIIRILPCGGPGDTTPYQRKYNRSAAAMEALIKAGAMTASLADDRQVFWLDLNSVFRTPEGVLKVDLMPDMIHPNANGAEAMAAAMAPMLDRLLH